jgi:hypothetical protein
MYTYIYIYIYMYYVYIFFLELNFAAFRAMKTMAVDI